MQAAKLTGKILITLSFSTIVLLSSCCCSGAVERPLQKQSSDARPLRQKRQRCRAPSTAAAHSGPISSCGTAGPWRQRRRHRCRAHVAASQLGCSEPGCGGGGGDGRQAGPLSDDGGRWAEHSFQIFLCKSSNCFFKIKKTVRKT